MSPPRPVAIPTTTSEKANLPPHTTNTHYEQRPPLREATTVVSNNHRCKQQPPLRHHATRWRARSGKEGHIDNNHLLNARENEIVTGDARQQSPHFPSITLPSFPLREPLFPFSHYERLLISGG